jgi:hemerythrin-like domain-containing protein
MRIGSMAANRKPPTRRNAKQEQQREQDAFSAIELLKEDHREVQAFFEKYEQMEGDAEKEALALKICLALQVHAQIEEEIFYPAARDAVSSDDEDLLDEAEVEHAGIKTLVAQLEDAEPDDDLYDAKVKVLTEYVKHHVKEEEGELFPKVKRTDLDLDQLGAELFERKNELMGENEDEEEDNPE